MSVITELNLPELPSGGSGKISYRMTISYDGTDYYGWQLQKREVTVAGVLAARFKKVFGREITIVGASRTDAGVHALGQVASFSSDLAIEPERLRSAWNGRLPRDITIRNLVVDASFYALRSVRHKVYWYHIMPQRPLPFFARYALWYRFPFNEQKFHDALQRFVGTHDFRSYCTGDDQVSTIRTVTSIHVEYVAAYGAHRVVVQGPGFLRYMIRRMVGAALHVATHDLPVDEITRVLQLCDPYHALPTAPAHGLLLRKVLYAPCASRTE